jgi:hypothetical protein
MQVDGSNWPLINVRWTDLASDDELAQFLSLMDLWLAKDKTFGLLIDCRGAQGLTSEQRKVVLAYMRNRSAETERLLVQGVVIDNAIQRALYFAISWAYPRPFPSKTFADVEAARAWIMMQLDARQRALAVP